MGVGPITEASYAPDLNDPAFVQLLKNDLIACRNRARSLQANYKNQKLRDSLESIVKRAQLGIDRLGGE